MAIKYAPRTQTAAIARAKTFDGHRYPIGRCQAFVVVEVFGTGAVGDYDGDRAADAEDGWKKAKAVGKVVLAKDIKDRKLIPGGLAMYWTGGSHDNGHAATSLPGGKLFTTDKTPGVCGIVDNDWPEKHWGLTFAGYVLVEGNGFTLTDRPSSSSPTTAVWGKPETWALGSVGPAVTRLGERLVVWAAALGLAAPYRTGPAPVFTETDRAAVAAFQVAQGWHGDSADGLPGPETFVRLEADPPAQPVLGPAVKSSSLNAGSYNARGAATYKSRVDRYVARRLKYAVDVMNLQEVGNGINRATKPNCLMRGRLDTELGKTYQRRAGDKGRYCYVNPSTVHHVKGGLITAATSSWYQGDDKQAAWEVYEKDGVLAMDVSLHLESDDGLLADAKRGEQILSILHKALTIADQLVVDVRNILFVGDTNSEGQVAAVMLAAGWRNVAAGGGLEHEPTFTGWDGRSHVRLDYGFVHETAAAAELTAVHPDPEISDHAELVIKRRLTRV